MQNDILIDASQFIQLLLLGGLYSLILYWAVKKTSKFVGNNSKYLIIFAVLIPVMILIISIIKSSLALSLGLVGALSIVRFRTPIKEAEELIYLFLAISVGLGLGAGQVAMTSIAFAMVIIIMFALSMFNKVEKMDGVYIDIAFSKNINLKELDKALSKNKTSHQLKRVEENNKNTCVTYFLNNLKGDSIDKVNESLKKLDKNVSINIINNI